MKKHLRKQMRAMLAAMPASEVMSKSRPACTKLTALPEFVSAEAVMIYLSLTEEVETLPIALAAWQQGKTVIAPKIDLQQRHIIPVEIRSLDSELVTGPLGIREPHYSEPWPLEDIDLVVVPALAFDLKGHRLGRGAGFYDRLFSSPLCRAFRCGLAFDEQVADELPITDNDQPVHALVTDKRVIRFPKP